METRFDIIARHYEKALALYPDARTDQNEVIKLLDIEGSEMIFETTCGTGFLTERIAGLLKSGKVISHDISAPMVELAKKKIEAKNITNVRFYITDNMLFPEIADNSIDKAVCFGGFHHIEEWVKLFRSIRRILKDGGIFVIGDFADNSAVQRYFDERIHVLTDTGHQGLFLSESQMINLSRFAGLKVVSVERKAVPFVFVSKDDAGVFYNLVHNLNQCLLETLRDIENYMGFEERSGKLAVPMDYIYAKYRKGGG